MEINLVIHKNQFWDIGEVFRDGIKIATINKFYEVDKQSIYIYETIGGSGTGYNKGNIKEIIPILGCKFSTEYR